MLPRDLHPLNAFPHIPSFSPALYNTVGIPEHTSRRLVPCSVCSDIFLIPRVATVVVPLCPVVN